MSPEPSGSALDLSSPSFQRLAAFGFGLTFASSIGQTFFIGLFGGSIQEDFDIDPGRWGLLYGAATLCSGSLMFWAGAQADRRPARFVLSVALGLLCAGAALMASATHLAGLWLAIFCLRFGGQGLAGHLAMVVAARAPVRRGRCLAIASLGFIAAEAVLPVTVVALRRSIDWREVWWLGLASVALVILPTLFWLGRLPAPTDPSGPTDGRAPALNRRDLLRQRPFWAALAAMLVPPFVVTALFLQQTTVIRLRDWTPVEFASGFLAFATAQAIANWFAGSLVDRYSARSLFRTYLVPMALGLVSLALLPGSLGLWCFFAGIGLSAGAQGVISAALWVELFGPAQLGLIRGVYFGFMVLSTAVSPFLLGAAFTAELSLSALACAVALYAALAPPIASRWLAPAQGA